MTTTERLLTSAIVRPPAPGFSEGLTTVDLGIPDYATALKQHASYCEALKSCGLTLTTLAPDDHHPDSTFVEDTALLIRECAIIARPGAKSRRGEIDEIGKTIASLFAEVRKVSEPGTVDGGDVCEAGNHFFIGISARTNECGAAQLASILSAFGYSSEIIDIRKVQTLLHLKSGLAYLGNKQLIVTEELRDTSSFRGYELIGVNKGDEYAANCVRINDSVLVAAGYPQFARGLEERGYRTLGLEMSEFQKMDGGLSCLSLRF